MRNYQKQIDFLNEQKQNVIYDAEHHKDVCEDKCRRVGNRRNKLNRRIINFAMSIVGVFKSWVDKDTYKLEAETRAVETFLKNNQ